MPGIDDVFERLAIDPAFTAKLGKDPRSALEGYDLTDDDLRLLETTVSAGAGDGGSVEQRTSKAGLLGLLTQFATVEGECIDGGGSTQAMAGGDQGGADISLEKVGGGSAEGVSDPCTVVATGDGGTSGAAVDTFAPGAGNGGSPDVEFKFAPEGAGSAEVEFKFAPQGEADVAVDTFAPAGAAPRDDLRPVGEATKWPNVTIDAAPRHAPVGSAEYPVKWEGPRLAATPILDPGSGGQAPGAPGGDDPTATWFKRPGPVLDAPASPDLGNLAPNQDNLVGAAPTEAAHEDFAPAVGSAAHEDFAPTEMTPAGGSAVVQDSSAPGGLANAETVHVPAAGAQGGDASVTEGLAPAVNGDGEATISSYAPATGGGDAPAIGVDSGSPAVQGNLAPAVNGDGDDPAALVALLAPESPRD